MKIGSSDIYAEQETSEIFGGFKEGNKENNGLSTSRNSLNALLPNQTKSRRNNGQGG